MFIAIIATALLLFGGIAYDAPRLITARQHATHSASEAARVASATIAAGGTIEQAWNAAERRLDSAPPLYGAPTRIIARSCTGTRVEITVSTWYANRSTLAVFRERQPIIATAQAESELVGPGGQISPIGYLPECPLSP